MCFKSLFLVLSLCLIGAHADEVPGYTRKATFAVARHGSKAWMGGIDFLDPEKGYLGPEQIQLLKEDASPEWIKLTGDKAKEDAAIAKAFGSGGASQLTQTGEQCEEKVGEFYKAYFGSGNAPPKTYVYSDTDQRDIKSGELFLQGLGRKGEKVDDSMPQMLAEMAKDKQFEGCPCATPNEIMDSVNAGKEWPASVISGVTSDQVTRYSRTQDIRDHFASELHYISEHTGAPISFLNRKEEWMGGLNEPLEPWKTLDGSLRPACMLLQVWDAEIASNVKNTMYQKLQVDRTRIHGLMRVCWGLWSIYAISVNRARTVELPIHLWASMNQAKWGSKSSNKAVKHAVDTEIVVYEAHNFNVDLLRQALGVQWSLGKKIKNDQPAQAWGCVGNKLACVENAQPYHTRVNIEIFQKSDSEEHFVRLSVLQVMLEQMHGSCTGGLSADTNLHVLAMQKHFCPGFVDATKMCPFNEFQVFWKNFLFSTQREDGGWCATEDSVAFVKAANKHPNFHPEDYTRDNHAFLFCMAFLGLMVVAALLAGWKYYPSAAKSERALDMELAAR